MTFEVGDKVYVLSLRKNGEVKSILSGGRLEVSIGSFQISCTPDDLQKKTKASEPRKHERMFKTSSSSSKSKKSLDLHGLQRAEATTLLESFLETCLREGVDEMHVIHGHGKGILLRVVEDFARKEQHVRNCKRHPQNAGISILYL